MDKLWEKWISTGVFCLVVVKLIFMNVHLSMYQHWGVLKWLLEERNDFLKDATTPSEGLFFTWLEMCRGESGLGCNEKRVIEILGRRTQAQRMEIAQAYQTVYSQSLHKRLKSAFSGKLEVSSSATSAPQPLKLDIFFPSFVLLSVPILQNLKSQV
jgi:hypothetical protein